MKHKDKTREQLIDELEALRRREEYLCSLIGKSSDVVMMIENKQMEEQIRKLSHAIEQSPSTVMITDIKGNIEYVNSKFTEITGYAADEIIGLFSGDLGEQSPEESKEMWDAITSNGEWRGLFFNKKKNGEFYWEAASISAVRNTDGVITNFIKVAEDITGRKRMEEALTESETRLRQITDNMLDIISLTDKEGTRQYISPSCKSVLGYEPGDMLGKAIFDFVHPYDKARVVSAVQMAISISSPGKLEYRDRHADGQYIWLETIGNPLFDSNGQITGAVFTSRDITGRKQMEDELRKHHEHLEELVRERTAELKAANEHLLQEIAERKRAEEKLLISEARYRNVVEDQTELISRILPDGTITFVNDAFCRYYGKNKEELIGQSVGVFVSNYKYFEHILASLNRENPVIFYEHHVVMSDGEVRWQQRNVRAIYNETGRLVEYQSVASDITERKRMEGKLHTARQQLMDIIDFLPDATFVINQDKKVIAWNRAIEEMTGVRKEDIIGKGDYAYSVPFYGSPRPLLIDLIFSDDKEAEAHYKYIKRTGNLLFTENYTPSVLEGQGAFLWGTAAPLYDRDGYLAGAIESIRNITERKRSEEALRQSGEYYRLLVENAPLGIIICDTGGNIKTVNPVLLKILGSPSKEATLAINVLTLPPLVEAGVAGNIRKCMETGETIIAEHPYKTKWGKIIFFRLHLTPLRDAVNVINGVQGIVEDFSKHKQIEEKLRYLSLYDSLTGLYNRAYFEQEMRRLEGGRHDPVGIIVCDIDGLKLVNDTLGHNTGNALLVAVAGVIREAFRAGDMMARIGGDEFAVLLPKSDRLAVESAAQRIRDNITRYNSANPGLHLSLSVGFAVSEEEPVSMDDLFKEADNNMYREKLHHRQSVRSAIVQTLKKALEARDFITEGHAERLEELLVDLAVVAGLPEEKIPDLRLLAQFHDIGKVGVPDRILFKPGPLTPEEVTEMQRHCEIGYRIAQSAPDLVPIADWLHKHHEWWNGGGYPFGLKGEEIPLECRILAIVDAYDAMTNDRPYRKAMTRDEAVTEVIRRSGSQFDPQLVQEFVQVLENRNRQQ